MYQLSNLKNIKIPVRVQQGLAISVYFVLAYITWDALPQTSVNLSSAREFILGFIAFISIVLGLGAYTLWVNSWWSKD